MENNYLTTYIKNDIPYFALKFEVDPALLAYARKIPSSKFNSKTFTWDVEANHITVKYVDAFARNFKFEYDNDAKLLIHELKKEFVLPEIKGLKMTPRPFQWEGIRKAVQFEKCLIADDMGCGKTSESIVSVHALNAYPCLVICPASIKLNWQIEIDKWLDKTSYVINGKKKSYYDTDFVIINYDILFSHTQYLREVGFKSIIVDECFVYETLVDTDKGKLKIGDIVTKKLKVNILSYNHKTQILEYKPIIRFIDKKSSGTTLKIKNQDTYIECSGNHKIFIKDRGYIKADEVKIGETMLILSKRFSFKSFVILFKRMFK